MTHAEINSAVRKLAYLKTPDKVRAGVRNMYGVSVSLERVERILSTLGGNKPIRAIGEVQPEDGDDFRVAGKVVPLVKAKTLRERRKIDPPARVYTPNAYARGLVETVCERLGLEVGVFYSAARFKEYVHARSLVAKLLQERNPGLYSSPFIAACIGRKDHTTVLFSLKQFDIYCRVNPDLAAAYREMRA